MLQDNARSLRKNMTAEERKLWYLFLKTLPQTIHRQKVIGRYIVDFYCASAGLVIELDGSQHFEETGITNDRERDTFLRSQGLGVWVWVFVSLVVVQSIVGLDLGPSITSQTYRCDGHCNIYHCIR